VETDRETLFGRQHFQISFRKSNFKSPIPISIRRFYFQIADSIFKSPILFSNRRFQFRFVDFNFKSPRQLIFFSAWRYKPGTFFPLTRLLVDSLIFWL